MAKKKDNLIDHFEISDDEISALMDELTRFSPSEAEPFFAQVSRVSVRSDRTAGKKTSPATAQSAAGRTSGESRYSRPERVSDSPPPVPTRSTQPSSDIIPPGTVPTSARPVNTKKKNRAIVWTVLILGVAVFAMMKHADKEEKKPLPKAAQPSQEVSYFTEPETEAVTTILHSDFYSHASEDSLKILASYLECTSVSVENGDLILTPTHDRNAMKTRLYQFFHNDLDTLIAQPGCLHFVNEEVNDDCTVVTITINDMNMSEDERKLINDILLCGTVYAGLSGTDNADVRIDFNNMLGQTVRTMNNSQ